jgi:aminoglycoside phosphotransferase (APT) family kinase protein
VFNVELVDGQRLVLKVQARGSRPERLLRERDASQLLARHLGIPVPEIIDLNSARDILAHNYVLLTHVHGVDGDAAWPEYPEAGQAAVMTSLGETLRRFHSCPLPPAGDLSALPTGRTLEDWTALQRTRFERAVGEHARRGYLPPGLLTGVRQFWQERAPLLNQSDALCLLHGDWQLWNVKLRPPSTEVAGVVDLDQVDIGRPGFDLAAMKSSILAERRGLRQAFYEGYAGGRALDEDFHGRIALHTLLRHLELMLAYAGPVRFPGGGSASAGETDRLITTHSAR